MSGKVKMRCARCHKPFKSSGAKDTLCPECALKERAARAAAKAAPVKPAHSPVPSIQALKISGPGAAILDPSRPQPAASPTPTAPPDAGPFGAAARQQERQQWQEQQRTHEREGRVTHDGRNGVAPQPTPAAHVGAFAQPAHPAHPTHLTQRTGAPASKPRTGRQQTHAPRPPRPALPPAPMLTDELRAQIEARYLELAQPVEFDGIRTQIATELSTPKSLVKKAVADLRARSQMPSWWDLRAYDGSAEQLERIRAAYTPLLPTPPVGVHKQLATDLGLDPRLVYQGIRRIRAEMRLPQYNPPETHSTTVDGAAAGAADGAVGAPQGADTTAHGAQQSQQTMMEVG